MIPEYRIPLTDAKSGKLFEVNPRHIVSLNEVNGGTLVTLNSIVLYPGNLIFNAQYDVKESIAEIASIQQAAHDRASNNAQDFIKAAGKYMERTTEECER